MLGTQVVQFGDNLTHENVFENDHDRWTFRIADVVVLREGFNRCYKYGCSLSHCVMFAFLTNNSKDIKILIF